MGGRWVAVVLKSRGARVEEGCDVEEEVRDLQDRHDVDEWHDES